MLSLRNLVRTYGDVVALDHLSFDVPQGSVFGFLGANGSGKTTAMRAIFGLTGLDAGSVTWRGNRVNFGMRRRFGYMPEERGLYADMLVDDQLNYFGRLHGMNRADACASTTRWLERVGLSERRSVKVEQLSMGNQQRVQLISSLIHEPELLVLDEPFSGLDPVGVDLMSEVLHERAADGVTVLFSSHQLDLVEDLCEAVAIIDEGRLVTEGNVDDLANAGPTRLIVEVANDPNAGWTAALGDTATIDSIDDGVATVTLEQGADDQAVLDAARRAGAVKLFTRKRRSLSEVFRDSMAMTR